MGFFYSLFMSIINIYNLYRKHFLVDTDTRNIRTNTMFFALKGANFNGNKFALDALEKGAKYAIVDELREDHKENKSIILVEDALLTLQELAKHHRQQLNIPIIALTGSNGKTTTKELINCVLSEKYKTTATIGNLNNHIGVPLTLLSINDKTEIGIIEMGANHPKEIAFLSEITQPDYGYITNFGKAHLEGFGSLEGVIKAKCELYDYLIKANKHIFINPKDQIQVEKTANANITPFNIEISFNNVSPFISLKYDKSLIKTNLIGSYNYNNIAIAITIGNYFKVDLDRIISAITNYIPKNNRSQIISTVNNEIILDAYNANPSSMEVAIHNLNLIDAKNKTLILGDMFELGEESINEHQKIIELVQNYNFKKVYLVGENFNKTNTKYLKFRDLETLKSYISLNKIQDNTILIKGSRGMALERILDSID